MPRKSRNALPGDLQSICIYSHNIVSWLIKLKNLTLFFKLNITDMHDIYQINSIISRLQLSDRHIDDKQITSVTNHINNIYLCVLTELLTFTCC
jgi:hypothetical protein